MKQGGLMHVWILGFITALITLTCCFSSVFATTQLDSSFGLNGRVAIELGRKSGGHALVSQPDGKIIIAGSSAGLEGGAMNFALLRLDQNGSLDTTFNHEGSVVSSLVPGDDEALAVGRLADGRIIAGGYSFNGTDRDFALACYSGNGTPDVRFGDNGATLTSIGNGNEEITALVIDPADRIVVVGSSEGTAGRILVAARYLPSGTLDRSFAEQGVALLGVGQDANAEGVLLRADGSIIIAGSYVDQRGQVALLVGLKADGSLDMNFGSQGIAGVADTFSVSEGYGVAEDQNKMIYLAGSIGELGKREAAVFRFTSNGMLDFAFGENGAKVIRQSLEDDVLYDVVAKNGSISAGGFTRQNDKQQMLLVSLVPTVNRGEGGQTSLDEEASAPIQEIRINGNTRVQIRKLQTWTSELLLRRMELLQSTLNDPSVRSAPPPQTGKLFVAQLLAPFGPSEAYAAAVENAAGQSEALETRILTTSIGNGMTVCYALAVDTDGQLLMVGTAEEQENSSIVVARFVDDDVIDRVIDRPGHRSSHISTLPSTDVTQTSLTTGGEISDSFPKKIVRRGVLFSLKPGQAYRDNPVSSTPSSRGHVLARIAQAVVPSAMAADGPVASTKTAPALEEGLTDNGSGTGVFYARLDRLLPSSIYYIRAYAMTANGEIYYGDQISVRTADACFIATASFGTVLHPCVRILRDFRDTFLVDNSWGQQVVALYYTYSPPVAAVIANSSGFRFFVRILLLPIVGFSWMALQMGIPGAIVCLVLLAALVGRRVRRIGLC